MEEARYMVCFCRILLVLVIFSFLFDIFCKLLNCCVNVVLALTQRVMVRLLFGCYIG